MKKGFPCRHRDGSNLGFFTCSVCGKEAKLFTCDFDVCKGVFMREVLDGVLFAESPLPTLRSVLTHIPMTEKPHAGGGQKDLPWATWQRQDMHRGFEVLAWQQVDWLAWIFFFFFNLNLQGHIRKMPSARCS